MKDIELPPLPDADVTNNTNLLGYRYSYSAISMQSYARSAVEADRAQRVPDGWHVVPRVATIDMIEAAEGVEDLYRRGTPETWAKVWSAMLASTPAQPARQEPSDDTIAQIDREIEAMLTQVESGSFPEFPARTLELAREVAKLIVAQHQEPPQQERKPMTDAEILEGAEALGSGLSSVIGAYFREGVRFSERHHGIKE